ncbi:MAG: serine/threonine-protein kinase [Luteolibacter sp.]|jgi:serine/threonine protein kinase|nr:serine/threonine-protein kinase [Luteolibacter sp.]
MSEDQPPATFVALDPAALAPLFPGYEIDTLIATGGMGAVYHAVQKSLERDVAIKILPHEFSADEAFCAGFAAEAKAMARLNHPNLIGVYDFGEIAGMLYIVMEYVPGNSLFHSAHGIAIDPAEVIWIVTGICNGLAHAHENGIIHRDIKPSNILLDLNANPKIGDFGLARPADHKVQEGEEIYGTPHYTAPEVISAPGSVDCRADLFSVGVMLHELLTGRLPAEDHRSASAISHCDPRFDAVIRRATDPFPSHRYSSASEIAHELHAIATTAGPRVLRTTAANTPISPGHRGKSSHQPNKSSNGPLIFVLLIAVAVAAIGYKNLSKQKAIPQAATEESAVPTPEAPPETPTVHEPAFAPEPAPQPAEEDLTETTPQPTPEPTPDAVPMPDPEPETSTTAGPKSDVPGFLARARKIMRDRSTPLIQAQDLKLKRNLKTFEISLGRVARSIPIKARRLAFEETLEEFIKECKQSGNRIPTNMSEDLFVTPSVEDLHADSLKEQKTIENSTIRDLSQFSATYILGIEKQIERLQSENDPLAIKLLEEEIETIRDDEGYFAELMQTPDTSPENP